MNDREEYKNKYNQEKRNGVFKSLIIILLIIVIILLLLHSCHQKNENDLSKNDLPIYLYSKCPVL